MIVQCKEEIFQKFEKSCGGDVALEGEIESFVYEAVDDWTPVGDSTGSFCAEIHSNNKILFLIIEDPDAFALGYEDRIKVVKSLDKSFSLPAMRYLSRQYFEPERTTCK